jgi:hypothetical protein
VYGQKVNEFSVVLEKKVSELDGNLKEIEREQKEKVKR